MSISSAIRFFFHTSLQTHTYIFVFVFFVLVIPNDAAFAEEWKNLSQDNPVVFPVDDSSVGQENLQFEFSPNLSLVLSPQYVVTQNDSPMDSEQALQDGSEFQESLFTSNKYHQYLGVGSLLFATATVLMIPGDETEGGYSPHALSAAVAAGLGVAAVVTGFVYHWDEIFEGGVMDPDNLHWGLGLVGTLGYLIANSTAPENVHAVSGIVGFTTMTAAIAITW